MTNYKKGFTLLEVLLVIGLIAILAGIVIVAINPSRQLAQANDTQRRADVQTILNAVYQFAIDNNGTLPTDGSEDINTDVRLLGTTGGDCTTETCTNETVDDAVCLDLSDALTPTYVGSMPINPGTTTTSYDASNTGYVISQDVNGRITVKSCEDDVDGGAISVTR